MDVKDRVLTVATALFLGLLVLIGLAACSATAPEAPVASAAPASCAISFEHVRQAAHSSGLVWREMTPLERSTFVVAYNAMPPASDIKPDRVGYFAQPGTDVVFLVMVDRDGCVLREHTGPTSRARVVEMMAGRAV